MAFKFIAFLAFVAVASAGLLPEAREGTDEYEGHPSYSFSYDVQDSNTGDFKSQSETRDGDNVQGQYSLHDADGYRRIVDYSSDAVNGFRASVRRERLEDVAVVAAQPAQVQTLVQTESKPIQQKSETIVKPAIAIQQPTFVRTYAAPTLVHHAPAHTVLHATSAVNFAPAAHHYVHAAPAAALVRTAPATHVITHHAPAVVHSSIATPHYQYHF